LAVLKAEIMLKCAGTLYTNIIVFKVFASKICSLIFIKKKTELSCIGYHMYDM